MAIVPFVSLDRFPSIAGRLVVSRVLSDSIRQVPVLLTVTWCQQVISVTSQEAQAINNVTKERTVRKPDNRHA